MRIWRGLQKRERPRDRKSGFLLLPGFAIFLLLSWFAVGARSMEASTHSYGIAQSQPAQQSAAPQGQTSLSQQLVKESREAAGEDDQAQFKHSGSVQFVARVTGLSLEQAYWLCFLLNFAIIAAAILWLMKKNLPAVFRSRTASIQKAMEEARQASQEANRRLADIESRLSRLDAEIGQIRAAAEKEAADEEQRIRAAAEEDMRKVVESAEQEIAAAAKTARRELTAFAANLAVSLAKKQIHVDTATDQALVRNFARQLSTDGDPQKKGN